MAHHFEFKQIGVIRTPYTDSAPYQPVVNDEGEFRIVLQREYAQGLADLETFRYIYVLYFVDRLTRTTVMIEHPAWTPDTNVGLFASRSPVRPNPLGLSVVQLKKIVGKSIFTSGLDVFDNTPLLDIKPYIKDLDSKNDANYGWIEKLAGNKQHLLLHIMGIPHGY
ncbi:MAG: tRNA (N6-threonylcarbamoyladenosine(37)-N6)-methyltransferase TrmO [Chitinivibrionales bacterium]|nr:tRNA (N6-threonylcarbamoyladenosine(37)-N6)-methyltransferase TrmO [Chitinivibrionales bacterium]